MEDSAADAKLDHPADAKQTCGPRRRCCSQICDSHLTTRTPLTQLTTSASSSSSQPPPPPPPPVAQQQQQPQVARPTQTSQQLPSPVMSSKANRRPLRNSDTMLTLLWKARKAGLAAPDKSSLQTLLSLPCLSDLDPVLASLWSLIRKFVRGNLDSSSLLKLLPQKLSIELQSMLITLLQEHQSQWKEELSRDQALDAEGMDLEMDLSNIGTLNTMFAALFRLKSILLTFMA